MFRLDAGQALENRRIPEIKSRRTEKGPPAIGITLQKPSRDLYTHHKFAYHSMG